MTCVSDPPSNEYIVLSALTRTFILQNYFWFPVIATCKVKNLLCFYNDRATYMSILIFRSYEMEKTTHCVTFNRSEGKICDVNPKNKKKEVCQYHSSI